MRFGHLTSALYNAKKSKEKQEDYKREVTEHFTDKINEAREDMLDELEKADEYFKLK